MQGKPELLGISQ
jgi:hypothetical protein